MLNKAPEDDFSTDSLMNRASLACEQIKVRFIVSQQEWKKHFSKISNQSPPKFFLCQSLDRKCFRCSASDQFPETKIVFVPFSFGAINKDVTSRNNAAKNFRPGKIVLRNISLTQGLNRAVVCFESSWVCYRVILTIW